jgi:hypothetical protein
MKYPNYPTDHIMTKTTYLDDPEGNGIELYCESPEDGTWTLANGVYETRRTDGTLSDGESRWMCGPCSAISKRLTAWMYQSRKRHVSAMSIYMYATLMKLLIFITA